MIFGIKNLLLVFFSLVPYSFYLDGEFVFDDSEAIVNNNDMDLNKSYQNIFYHDFWGSDINSSSSHKSYRPLTILSFRFNRQFDNGDLIPYNFKKTNLVLHAFVTILVYNFLRIVRRCKTNAFKNACDNLINNSVSESASNLWKDESFLSSILFAVHPIHVEAVSGIVGRADILAALFFFLSFIFYDKSFRVMDERKSMLKKCLCFFSSIIFTVLAILSKETGITVLVICSIHDILNNVKFFIINKEDEFQVDNTHNIKEKSLKNNFHYKSMYKFYYIHKELIMRQCIIFIVIISLLYARFAIMNFENPQFQATDNPTAFSESRFNRMATYNYLYFINLLIMIWPQWLCFDWSMGCVSIVNSLFDYRLIFVAFLWIYIIATIYRILSSQFDRNQTKYYVIILSTMVIPFLPASNVIMPVGFVIAERILYIPSVGFCAIVVNGMKKICSVINFKYQKIMNLLFIVLIFIMTIRTIQRSNNWQNEKLLYNSGLEVCPNNAKVHYNIAKVAGDNNDIIIAEEKYNEAIRLNPTYYQAMNNLANLLKEQNRFGESESLLKNAIRIKYDFPAAWMNLGIVLANMNRAAESENAYFNAFKYRKDYADCHYNLGKLYLDQNKHEMALKSWFEATRINPTHAVSWSNILALLDNTGQIERALKLAPSVLSILPNVHLIHFNIANVLGKNNDFLNAEKHFLKAIELTKNKTSAIYFSNLGVLYHRWKKPNNAREMYMKALSVDPLLKSARENLQRLK